MTTVNDLICTDCQKVQTKRGSLGSLACLAGMFCSTELLYHIRKSPTRHLHSKITWIQISPFPIFIQPCSYRNQLKSYHFITIVYTILYSLLQNWTFQPWMLLLICHQHSIISQQQSLTWMSPEFPFIGRINFYIHRRIWS